MTAHLHVYRRITLRGHTWLLDPEWARCQCGRKERLVNLVPQGDVR